jgi:hypothetical protein
VLVVVSLVLSLGFVVLGVVDPQWFENDFARFMLCVAVALLLAVFFFIFYPQQLQMKMPVVAGTTVRLAGPVVLFVSVLLLLWRFMPSPEYGRVFEIWCNGKRGGMYLGDSSTTYFTAPTGRTSRDPFDWSK